jgi:hypothetical protein
LDEPVSKYHYFDSSKEMYKYIDEINTTFRNNKKYYAELVISPRYKRVHIKITKEPIWITEEKCFSMN